VTTQRRVMLYVVNDAWFLASHRSEVVAAAIAAGYEVHIAARRDETVEGFEAQGCHFHDWRLAPRNTGIRAEGIALVSLYRIIRALRPDTMHLITIKSLIYGGLIARGLKIPSVVFAVAGLGNFFVASSFRERLVRAFASLSYRTVLRHPNAHVIVQNASDRELFVSNRWIDPAQVTLIRGSGVDLERFRASPEPEGPTKVLLASRLLWRKGIREYVEAARQIRERHPDVRFLLAGVIDGENAQSISEDNVREWREAGTIEWRGRCDDMAALLSECHVICLPTYYGEGLPKVLIEACASARAVVCTDWPGCSDIVSHEDNGLLVPPRDVGALQKALSVLIEQPDERKRMARRGREVAEAGFSVTAVVADTLDIYAGLEREAAARIVR